MKSCRLTSLSLLLMCEKWRCELYSSICSRTMNRHCRKPDSHGISSSRICRTATVEIGDRLKFTRVCITVTVFKGRKLCGSTIGGGGGCLFS